MMPDRRKIVHDRDGKKGQVVLLVSCNNIIAKESAGLFDCTTAGVLISCPNYRIEGGAARQISLGCSSQ